MPSTKEPNGDKNLSVLIPVKNGGSELAILLNFLTLMLTAEDEILLIDDNSRDSAIKELNLEKISCATRILQSKGSGIVDALNLGLKESRHELIARVDVGDYYHLERFLMQREQIKENVVAIFSDYIVEDVAGNSYGYISSAVTSSATKLSLLKSQRTAHPSVIFRKSAALSVGGYLGEEFPAEDLGLWLRISALGDFKSIPSALLIYRLSINSITWNNYQLAKETTARLLSSDGTHRRTLARILEDAFRERYSTLEMYKDLHKGEHRAVLFLGDFLNPRNMPFIGKWKFIRFFLFALIRLLNPTYWPTIIRLFTDRKKRKRLRKSK